jgi:uncharacterized protein (UPF0297 family)
MFKISLFFIISLVFWTGALSAKEVKVKIHASIPEISAKLLPMGNLKHKVELWQGNKKFQEVVYAHPDLEGDVFKDIEMVVSFDDYNFDGFKDLALLTMQGTSNYQQNIYLYHQAQKQFVLNANFSQIECLYANPKKKLLYSHVKGGYAGLIFTNKVFKIEKNKPVLIEKIEQELLGDTQEFLKKVYLPVKGKMTKIVEIIVTYNESGKATLVKIKKGTKEQVKKYLQLE